MVARKSSSTPTQIWTFGARPPVEGGERVEELLRLSDEYYDKLIEIEIARLSEYRETRRFYAPELVECEEQLADAQASTGSPVDREARVAAAQTALRLATAQFEASLQPARDAYEERTSGAPAELLVELRAARQESRSAKRDGAAQIREAQAVLREATREGNLERRAAARSALQATRDAVAERRSAAESALKAVKSRMRAYALPPRTKAVVNDRVLDEMLGEDWPEAWQDLAQADRSASDQRKQARAQCGLPPGVYLLVEAAVAQAIDSRRAQGRGPKRVEVHQSWRIGVQLLPALTWAELCACTSTKVRLELGEQRGRRNNATVALRVGSNPDRSPIWARWPVRIHRALDPGAAIKWAWVSVRRSGLGYRYELQLTNESEAYVRVPPESGHVSVDLTPETTRAGIVVATWSGSDGRSGQVELGHELLHRIRQSDAVRAARERLERREWRLLRWVLHRSGSRITGWRPRHALTVLLWARDWSCLELGGRDRVESLWRDWRGERLEQRLDLFAGGRAIAAWAARHALTPRELLAWQIELWRRKDAHLRQLADGQSRRSRKGRDEQYRVLASALARQYRTLSIDTSSRVPGDGEQGAQARALATGRLREVLVERFTADFVATARKAERTLDPSPGEESTEASEVPGAA